MASFTDLNPQRANKINDFHKDRRFTAAGCRELRKRSFLKGYEGKSRDSGKEPALIISLT